MKRNSAISLTVITALIGLMLAIQYNSTKSDDTRDTRDLWDLRVDYLDAKEMETTLIQEIRSTEEKISQYETARMNSKEQILRETVSELRREAGLEETVGPGIVITLVPAMEFIVPGQTSPYISPELLRKLINELNMYGALSISINDQRIINTTAIREIQGETKIDGYPLRQYPLEVKVVTADLDAANKIYNRMQISTLPDDFIIDNLQMSVSDPMEKIEISAYQNPINVNVMKPVNEEGGDN